MKNRYNIFSKLTGQILLCLLAVFFIVPIYWLIVSAFKTPEQLGMYPPEWWPSPWTIRSFKKGLSSGLFLNFFKNTTIITFLCIVGSVASSSLVAYGFARIRSSHKKIWFSILLSTMMIPSTVTLIPVFAIYSNIGWVDTYLPLVVPAFLGGGAFNIFLLRQFFNSIPKELGEAATLDGCTSFGVFRRVYLPNTKPALIVVSIFMFVNTWNDYFSPMIFLTNPKNFTLSIGIVAYRSQYGGTSDYGPLMAMALLSVLPVLVIYLFFQRYFIQGIVTTGIKG